MDKSQLLEEIRAARAKLLAAIEGLTDAELVQPGAAGIWSVKDIMAHLIAWEAELVTLLSRKLSKRYKDAPQLVLIEDLDEWNEEQYHLNARKPLSVILPDFHGVHKHLLRAIEEARLRHTAGRQPLRMDGRRGAGQPGAGDGRLARGRTCRGYSALARGALERVEYTAFGGEHCGVPEALHAIRTAPLTEGAPPPLGISNR